MTIQMEEELVPDYVTPGYTPSVGDSPNHHTPDHSRSCGILSFLYDLVKPSPIISEYHRSRAQAKANAAGVNHQEKKSVGNKFR